jgi:hypothetical protein
MSAHVLEPPTTSIAAGDVGGNTGPAACLRSNGSRLRLWKIQLQRLANETGLGISVCHLPPGTSKWNKIEHRLFCHITRNWRGRPLVSLEAVVNLIANARTDKGLVVNAALDEAAYAKGITVSDAELAAVQLERDAFHGEWNYTTFPI